MMQRIRKFFLTSKNKTFKPTDATAEINAAKLSLL